MAALPGVVPGVLLMDELRKLREREHPLESGATPPTGAHFVCDAQGNVSNAHVASVVAITTSLQGQVLGTVAATVVSVSDAAASAADATAQAASKAASATLDAATRAAISTKETVAALGRQLTNADRITELRSDAEVLAGFQGSREWRDLMRALFAVGIAIAAADGEVTDSERQDIEDFVGGAGYSALPAGLKSDVQAWLVAPPTIEQAFKLASKCGENGMVLVDNVMDVITRSDDVVHPAETAFRDKWFAMRQGQTA